MYIVRWIDEEGDPRSEQCPSYEIALCVKDDLEADGFADVTVESGEDK